MRPSGCTYSMPAGLTVTAKTTATGSLFTALPALDMAGVVSVTFADKTREEAMMRQTFGPEYDAYCARTKRLVPGIF